MNRATSALSLLLGLVAISIAALAFLATSRGPTSAPPSPLTPLQIEYQFKQVNDRIDSLWSSMRMVQALSDAKWVDLRSADLQDIGDGFTVGHLKVEAEPGGLRLSGIVLNREAVDHRSAQFKLVIGNAERDFTVMVLPSGTSGHFSVAVPGARADSAFYGTIKFQRSTMGYHGGP